MYWRNLVAKEYTSSLTHAVSPVDSILDKEDYTLEELLDEDELIQECKSLNTRLIIFLKQPSSVRDLVRYIVEPAPEDTDDAKRRFKYPFAACEVFCCEVDGIFQTLVEDEDLLDLLFSLLHNASPLNCMLAGYFSRVVACLLARRPDDMGAYLEHHPELLRALCAHCTTTSVAEVIVRLVGAAGEEPSDADGTSLGWLAKSDLLPLLLETLSHGEEPDAASNAAEILAAVASSPGSVLIGPLSEPEVLSRLVDAALGALGPGPASHALDVCLALVEGVGGPDGSHHGEGSHHGAALASIAPPEPVIHAHHLVPIPVSAQPTTPAALPAHVALRSNAIACLVTRVDRLVCLLDLEASRPQQQDLEVNGTKTDKAASSSSNPNNSSSSSSSSSSSNVDGADIPPRETSYGLAEAPVGMARIKTVELLAALARSRSPDAERAVASSGAIKAVMSLFLEHPFNNALHHAATRLFTCFEVAGEDLVRALLGPGESDLVTFVLDAPREIVPRLKTRVADDNKDDKKINYSGASDLRPPMRAGYSGHLTHVANRLLAIASGDGNEISGNSPPISPSAATAPPCASLVKELLDAQPHWTVFVREVLEPRNDIESVRAWRCGRPSGGGGQDDLADFQHDVYQRYGIFEEEDDEDEDDSRYGAGLWASSDAAQRSSAFDELLGARAVVTPVEGQAGLEAKHNGDDAFARLRDSGSSSSSDGSDEDEEARRTDTQEQFLSPRSNDDDDWGEAAQVQSTAEHRDELDMAGDAVLLDVEAAENLVSLQSSFENALRIEQKGAEPAIASEVRGESPSDETLETEWHADFGEEGASK